MKLMVSGRNWEDSRVICTEVAEVYASAVRQFGGVTSRLPPDCTASGLLGWIKSNLMKLPTFLDGVSDFSAMASATNICRFFLRGGLSDICNYEFAELADPSELEETARAVKKNVRNFMMSFWSKFGRAEAIAMAEAKCRVVGGQYDVNCFLLLLFLHLCRSRIRCEPAVLSP